MKKNKPVFHDLGFNKYQSVLLTLKSDLYSKLLEIIRKQNLKPRDLEKIFDVPQPRISELFNGKISSLSLEKLISYLGKLGVGVTITFKTNSAG